MLYIYMTYGRNTLLRMHLYTALEVCMMLEDLIAQRLMSSHDGRHWQACVRQRQMQDVGPQLCKTKCCPAALVVLAKAVGVTS